MKFVLFIALLFLTCATRLTTAQRAKAVFAHYVPWYDGGGLQYPTRTGWCFPDNGTFDCTDTSIIHYSNFPLLGEYSQFDDDVLEYHVLTAYVAGIDGFIVNINPGSSLQKEISLKLLQKISSLKSSFPSFDFKVMVSYDDGAKTDQSLITNYLTWVYDNIYNTYSSLIFRDDSRNVPVLLAWSESDPSHYFTTVQSLFSGNVQFMIRNAVNFDYSTGNFEWVNNLNTGRPKTNSANWGQQYFEDFDYIMARQTGSSINAVKMGGVYPRFDDDNVPAFWNGGTNRYHLGQVDDGITMELTWNKQITYSPLRLGGTIEVENPWIQITTWNDWPEGTSIEPATEGTYGYTALEINRVKIAEFKGASAGYGNECLFVPYTIYQTRKSGGSSDADDLVMQLLGAKGTGSCGSPSPTVSPSPIASPSPTQTLSSDASSFAIPSASSSLSPSSTTALSPSQSPSSSPRTPLSASASPSVSLSLSTSPYFSPSPSTSPSLSPSPSSSSSPKCPCICKKVAPMQDAVLRCGPELWGVQMIGEREKEGLIKNWIEGCLEVLHKECGLQNLLRG